MEIKVEMKMELNSKCEFGWVTFNYFSSIHKLFFLDKLFINKNKLRFLFFRLAKILFERKMKYLFMLLKYVCPNVSK